MAGRPRPGARAILAAVLLHVLAAVVLVATGLRAGSAMPEFEVYRVSIVSPAPQVQGPPQPVTTTPEPEPELVQPEPEEVEPEPAPVRAEQPKPRVEKKPEPPAPRTEKPPEKKDVVSSGRDPDPTSAGGEGLNVDIEGVACPSPEYCENIIRQAYRYFRWTGGSRLSALVYFEIRRDGSVEDIRTIRSSGNVQFDFTAEGAIEAAGDRKSFGPLPAAFQRELLPVQLRFSPP